MSLTKHKSKRRKKKQPKPVDPVLFIKTQALQIEHKKTQIVRRIFRKLGIEWTEINWNKVRKINAKEGFAESLYYEIGTEAEKHLCDFDIKVQDDGFYLDVKSDYL